MELLQKLREYIAANALFQPQDKLLLAVSGGVDSAVLCSLCEKMNAAFSIAHCNFQLRGEESVGDEDFVQNLSVKYKVPFFIKKFDTAAVAGQNKTGVEETARNLRYTWFAELIKTNGYAYLVTGHHADDNIETVLMNFFRGTGIKGLRGMQPKQNNIIRPLLFATREEIEAYAAKEHIQFRADSSNLQNDYTRNLFRNEIIPAVKKVFPKAKENILGNIERFTDMESLYNESIAAIKKKLIEKKGDEIHIPVLKLAKTKPLLTVIHEIIRDYGFTAAQSPGLLKLLNAGSGKYLLSNTHRILKNRNWLIISPLKDAPEVSHFLIEEDTGPVSFPRGKLSIAKLNKEDRIDPDASMAYINAGMITYPLLLRRWRQGDYFYPLGMAKKKKLSRFFTDNKLSLLQKENVWVLESAKKIVWVVGYRIDNRFRLPVLPGENNFSGAAIVFSFQTGSGA